MKFLNLSSDTFGRVPADPLLAVEGVVVAVGVLGRRPELKKQGVFKSGKRRGPNFAGTCRKYLWFRPYVILTKIPLP